VGVNVICQFKKVKNRKLKLSKVVEILRTSTQLVRTRQHHGCSTQALMVVGFNPIPIAPGGLMGGCCAPPAGGE
jgi:hypothetical protein